MNQAMERMGAWDTLGCRYLTVSENLLTAHTSAFFKRANPRLPSFVYELIVFVLIEQKSVANMYIVLNDLLDYHLDFCRFSTIRGTGVVV